MKIERKVMCAIRRDSVGNIIDYMEVKTVDEKVASEYENKANEYKALKQKDIDDKKKVESDKVVELQRSKKIKDFIATKLIFDSYVDLGKAETTEMFEHDFESFLNTGVLDITNAPTMFKVIYEKVVNL